MSDHGIAALAALVTVLSALSVGICWALVQAAVWMATCAVMVQ